MAEPSMALYEKMDALRSEQFTAPLLKQQEQIVLLTRLLARTEVAGSVGALV